MQKPHCHQVWAAAELAMFGAACCNAPSSRAERIAMFLEHFAMFREHFARFRTGWNVPGRVAIFQERIATFWERISMFLGASPCSGACRHIPGCIATSPKTFQGTSPRSGARASRNKATYHS